MTTAVQSSGGKDLARFNETIDAIDELLVRLRDDASIPPFDRVTLGDIQSLFHTGMRSMILRILIPVLKRLRNRITSFDVKYFAGSEFTGAVSKAIEERCREIVSLGEMDGKVMGTVRTNVMPILSSIHIAATEHLAGDCELFEYVHERLVTVLDGIAYHKT